jgi:hypothetical protein
MARCSRAAAENSSVLWPFDFFLQSHAYDAAGETIAHATSTWKLLK